MAKFLLLFLILSSGVFADFLDKLKEDKLPWEEIRNDEGITVYKKELKISDLFVFKAQGELNAPIESLLSLLRQVNLHTQWSPSLVSKKSVQEISDIEVITHDVHFLPWPLSNRDLIVHNKLYLDKKEKFLVVGSQSVKHEAYPPDDGFVRGELALGTIFIRPLSPTKTFVKLLIHIDPKGSIPSFIVNEIQKNWPIKYLKKLEKLAQKIKPNLNPGIKLELRKLRQLLRGETHGG